MTSLGARVSVTHQQLSLSVKRAFRVRHTCVRDMDIVPKQPWQLATPADLRHCMIASKLIVAM
jgi:hypothetical protein